MTTTIAVSEETRRRLMALKAAEGARSVDELLGDVLLAYRKARLLDASTLFRQKLSKSGLTLKDLVE